MNKKKKGMPVQSTDDFATNAPQMPETVNAGAEKSAEPQAPEPPEMPQAPEPQPHPWDSEPEVGELLAAISRNIRASVIIEVGCFRGATTKHLVATGAMVHAVDIEPKIEDHHDNLFVHAGDSIEVSPMLPQADLIYFDAVHEFKRQINEFQQYERKNGHANTVYAFHDAIHIPEVARFIDWLRKWYDVVVINTTGNRGIAIAKYRRPAL